MKIVIGILLLLSGWGIVLAAVALLGTAPWARIGFVVAGLVTEGIGLAYFVRSHVSARGVRE
jgi:TM2 domain-containing membrane protein YozV